LPILRRMPKLLNRATHVVLFIAGILGRGFNSRRLHHVICLFSSKQPGLFSAKDNGVLAPRAPDFCLRDFDTLMSENHAEAFEWHPRQYNSIALGVA
jgi:hypothetical protein